MKRIIFICTKVGVSVLLLLVLRAGAYSNDNVFVYKPEVNHVWEFRNKASEFELKDQYNNSFSVNFPRSKNLVLVFGDRKGSSQIENWVRPLYSRYENRVDIYGVAELSSVPYLLQGMVRQIFKSQVKYSVMLDWSGKVSKSYNYQPGRANVMIINKDGHIIFRQTGAASENALNKIYELIG